MHRRMLLPNLTHLEGKRSARKLARNLDYRLLVLNQNDICQVKQDSLVISIQVDWCLPEYSVRKQLIRSSQVLQVRASTTQTITLTMT